MIFTDFNRETLRTLAKVGVLTVTFEKADYSTRLMVCTLHPDYLDKVSGPALVKPSTRHRDNNEPLRVFDLEAGEWRQFTATCVQKASWEAADADAIDRMYSTLTREFKVRVEFPKNETITPTDIRDAIIKAGIDVIEVALIYKKD